ncbi:MAG: hypothetical protein KF696_04755 [Planctomycetes bacterium]|nr:hypothetical protein [Planctomycetota bacterium]MCW8134283.1 hypothetical protein [Planctomycetota bacterium]
MSRTRWALFALVAVLSIVAAGSQSLAQRGKDKGKGGGPPGPAPWKKGGKGDANRPQLKIEDIKADGVYEVFNLLPAKNDQPRIGVTDKIAYRLASYDPPSHTLKFVVLDIAKGGLSTKSIKLPSECPAFNGIPRMAYDSGDVCMISQQAATVFVDVVSGKVKFAAGFDAAVPQEAPRPKGGDRGWPKGGETSMPASSYRVHGSAGGRFALSVRVDYDSKAKTYGSNGATLHGMDIKSQPLAWDHNRYGVPPPKRDGVFAVTDSEIVVLVTRPKTAGSFGNAHELSCLVFDRKGALKEVQTNTENWHGRNAERATISPCGQYIVAHPEDGLHRFVVKRGTWERGYKTDYNDACVGFAPSGGIGVFIENKTPQRATLKAIKLENAEVLWETSVLHDEVQGEGDDEPFTSVGPGAIVVAAKWGICSGTTSDTPTMLYAAQAIDFVPLAMSYDEAGKLVAVLATDRIFVLDAKTRNEVMSVQLPKALPANALGEFITFDTKARKLMACARNQGAWVVDVATSTLEATLPAIPGTFARALPDLSGIIYSQPKDQGGNVMIQKADGSEAQRLYRCEYKDTLAVCLWVDEKGKEFLITEREVGEGKLFLVNEKGEKTVKYNVADADTNYTGDTAVAGFVTKKKEVVLINETSRWGYTGINCSVIFPGESGIDTIFTAIFKSEDLPGRSTYGMTAASPFFGQLHWGDINVARFACPAGVLEADIAKGAFTLYAWSRAPQGLTTINPKGREFFVAGTGGLTTYKLK